ncbi:MAG: hypothetical protein EAZ74_02815 [Alphaproteobacteria bacterium]|nr:MAG: hypothetical protein EAY76_02600 [Alphaproteobacteria bacterium]TAF14907.1 MAG: hypothetical protein EAZ74_02815 [Alphaproteobacteria bacterium]TAF38784.1 MAG: hypothetical protein EAZ66_05815 [Alphaproteobacteria bacterium]TAF77185.1 MAG: hypothetical protein EAZ52_01225 [Alphaproteobacteria bacterium]
MQKLPQDQSFEKESFTLVGIPAEMPAIPEGTSLVCYSQRSSGRNYFVCETVDDVQLFIIGLKTGNIKAIAWYIANLG